ncbi:MAG TPA: gamma carbonic anhydrase family protein [Syntrophorhabdaceae bacterium]|nr:gamma carbonic anhydrase family protein [Syntrophorhabdaceae bacterium]
MIYRFDGKEPKVGKGTYISETAIVIGDVIIGNDCYIGHGSILRGDYGRIEIGNETSIEEGVIVHAPPDDVCYIGNGVIIGHGAIIHAKSIDHGSLIGMGAILSLRSEIGKNSTVAEGAIIKNNQVIGSSIMVAGNPARKIRETNEKDRKFWEYTKNLYVELAHKYLRLGIEKI